MLKLKKYFLTAMMAAMTVTLVTSCSANDDDENEGGSASGSSGTVTEVTASSFYGTYKGTWSILGNEYPMSVITAENTLYCESDMMTLSYEHVWWTKDSDGNFICNGNHETDSASSSYETASTTVTFDSSTKTGMFSVVAMAALASPCEVTLSSTSVEVPVAYYVAGQYRGSAAVSVMGVNKEFTGLFTIVKTDTDKVSLTVPSMAYSDSMTFPEYTLENGTVTGEDGVYTIAFDDFVSESDENGKTVTVTSISASVKDSCLSLTLSEKYGSMPMAATLTVQDISIW